MTEFFTCIYCEKPTSPDDGREHIISESLGGTECLPAGWVCRKCNQSFSKFERIVLNDQLFSAGLVINNVEGKTGKRDLKFGKGGYVENNEHGGVTFVGAKGELRIDKNLHWYSRLLAKTAVNTFARDYGPRATMENLKLLRLFARFASSKDQLWFCVFSTAIGTKIPSGRIKPGPNEPYFVLICGAGVFLLPICPIDKHGAPYYEKELQRLQGELEGSVRRSPVSLGGSIPQMNLVSLTRHPLYKT